jgi:hypothetical protein
MKSRKLNKDRQHNGQIKNDKGQTMVYKTLHRKTKIEQHELMAKRKRTNNGL